MRGDDELAAVPHTVGEQCDQRQYPGRRQRRLRFVEEIQPVRHQPGLQQGEERLAMRTCIGIGAVAPRQCHALAACDAHGVLAAGPLGQLPQVPLDFAEIGHVAGQPASVAEHVLGAQEQPGARVAMADEHEAGGQISRGLQRRIALQVMRASRHRRHADGDALKQRRLAAAVLARQESHGCGEFQCGQIAHQGQRPGEPLAIDGGVRPPAQC